MKLSLLVLAMALGSVSATGPPVTMGIGKNGATDCQSPIGQISCRVQPNGKIEGIGMGAWGTVPAALVTAVSGGAHIDYLGPDASGLFFTQNWCRTFGQRPRCTTGTLGSNLLGAATWDGSTTSPVYTMNLLTGMTICYGKKSVRGITWNSQAFSFNYAFVINGTAPPQCQVDPGAVQAPVTCGLTTGCKYESTYTAPDGQVIGGMDTKCKFTQGWFKYVQNGQYKARYFLENIKKVCVLPPKCPPIGKFRPCPGCTTPNDPGSAACATDFSRYQCDYSCKKKKL